MCCFSSCRDMTWTTACIFHISCGRADKRGAEISNRSSENSYFLLPKYLQAVTKYPSGFLLRSVRSVDPWPETSLVKLILYSKHHIQRLKGPKQQWIVTQASVWENKIKPPNNFRILDKMEWNLRRDYSKSILSVFSDSSGLVVRQLVRSNLMVLFCRNTKYNKGVML